MGWYRQDPGECPVCGAAHSACTGPLRGPIVIEQLPLRPGLARDAEAARIALGLEADKVQATLRGGQFTTGTYRRRATNTPPRK